MYTKKIYISGDLNELQKIFNGVEGVLKITAGNFAAQNKSEGLIASDVMNSLPDAIKKLRAIGYQNS